MGKEALDNDLLDFVLRKCGHMAVFAILAILVARIAGPGWQLRPRVLAAAWLATFAWACSDEWHQSFVEGRHGAASDVAFDMVGATLALASATWLATRQRAADTIDKEPT